MEIGILVMSDCPRQQLAEGGLRQELGATGLVSVGLLPDLPAPPTARPKRLAE
ncbi:hypothetical protein ACFW6S_35275 [Streptomyces sp. NPDC058740]|uniref:hypothetical protein n=1 Tax=Streptomyces sp. NPDC058740 TaxID=3346619 RepID=UPI0036831F3F